MRVTLSGLNPHLRPLGARRLRRPQGRPLAWGASRLARSDTTGDLKRTSQIGFLSLKRKPLLRGPQAQASQWGRELSSLLAWPGYKIGHPLSDGRADLLPRPYPLAILPNGVLRRCQDRLHNHPKVSCTFGPNVGCACASVQASRPGFPGDRPKLQWLISLNRRTRTTLLKVPACQTGYSGHGARRCRRCKIAARCVSLATAR